MKNQLGKEEHEGRFGGWKQDPQKCATEKENGQGNHCWNEKK